MVWKRGVATGALFKVGGTMVATAAECTPAGRLGLGSQGNQRGPVTGTFPRLRNLNKRTTPMSHESSRRSFLQWLADCLFLPLAIVYAFSAAALGCSGSVSVGSNSPDPNRALGTYETGSFSEAASTIFFGYWLDGDSGIDPEDGEALRQAVGPIRCRARIAIVPSSILYEETATELATGDTITVSLSGTWSYDGQSRLRVDWGAAFVTESTFPTSPPYELAAVGTQIQEPQPGDLIFANSAWSTLTNVVPGPLDGAFTRVD